MIPRVCVCYFTDSSDLVGGIIYLFCPLVIVWVGRERLFKLVAYQFEGDKSLMQKDGAFISSLLEGHQVEVGQSWWVHLSNDEKDGRYSPSHHRHNWR